MAVNSGYSLSDRPLWTDAKRSKNDGMSTMYKGSIRHRLSKLEWRVSRLDDALTEIDNETNLIATELEQLRGQITAGDAGAADRLQPVIDRLKGLAQDPANPVPSPEPTPPAA